MSALLQRLKDASSYFMTLAEDIKAEAEAQSDAEIFDAIRYFDGLRSAHELFQEAKKIMDASHDRLSREIIPDHVRAHAEKTGVKPPYYVEGVGRVSVAHRFSCSMLDKDKGIVWLKDKGYSALVQETVNSATLGAFAKNLIQEEGKELPDDIFKTGTSPYTSITKK